MKYFLPSGLLTSYFFWWRFALATVRCASLNYLVWYRHCWKKLKCKLNIQRLTKEYKIIWFKFDLCGLRYWQDKDKRSTAVTTSCNGSAWYVTSKLATKWNTSYLLGCWLSISSGDGLHLWLLGAQFYLTLFGIDTVENSWGVKWICRDLPRNIQSFGSSLIYVVYDIRSGTIAQNKSDKR